jgi:sugar diacid utilization regulator
VHEFPREELLLLSTIANQAAIAIETKRLRDEERETIARLEQAKLSLEAQAFVLEASEQIHGQLTRVVLEDAGLLAIAEALTRVLRGSVVIVDMAGNPLGTSEYDDIPAVLPPALRENRAVAARIGALLTGQEPRAVSGADDPALEHRAFVAPILIGREPVGRLWVLGVVEDLGALERRALEHGATVIALELLKQRTAAEVEARLRGELLDDLLSERLLDTQSLHARASHLDLDLSLPYAALVIGFDPPPGVGLGDRSGRGHQVVSLAYSVVRRANAAALTGTDRDGRVVLLLADPGSGGATAVTIADTIRREAHYLLPATTVSVAIGPAAVGQPGYLRSYRIARGALELARGTTADRTLRVDALGLHGLLLSVERLDELVAFAACQLGPLRVYDARRGSDLVATLRTYLAHGCRTAETAVALVVHPNTVAYRIRRIQAVLGVDLAQPTAQLELQLALIVSEIVGPEEAARDRPTGGPAPAT